MTYINIEAKSVAPRGFRARAIRSEALQAQGVMPTHVFLRLFLSAFAAILLIHCWKHGGR